MADIFEILTVGGSHAGFIEEGIPFDMGDGCEYVIHKVIETPELRTYLTALRANKKLTDEED